ncbi:RDD family protein [Longispora sp. K20-0274]|uniref:RDD family protein n=1 Tax=Longispora sp. K20-0274 TaxID=3088255 RepID=UPI00399A7051
MAEDTPVELASMNQRFGALLIDWLLCMLIVAPFSQAGWMGAWALLALVAEYTFFVGLFGQTPGMRVLHICCQRVPDGGPIGVPRAFLRGLLLALVIPAVIMDDYGRGLHDRWVGSIMIKA